MTEYVTIAPIDVTTIVPLRCKATIPAGVVLKPAAVGLSCDMKDVATIEPRCIGVKQIMFDPALIDMMTKTEVCNDG